MSTMLRLDCLRWRWSRWALSAALAGSIHTLGPTASACGGTFCDQGPSGRIETVDQSGENVVFVYGEGVIEAHVQISYEGDPEEMAWLVPMPTQPEVEVGSQALFDTLLSTTAPTFSVNSTFIACDGESSGCSSSMGVGAADDSSSVSSGGAQDETETVIEPIGQTVGAFDISFLEGQNTAAIMTWLEENNFSIPERTEELVDIYANQGSVLVAIKLRPDAGVDEIHPLVLRYQGDTPLIPIRLTAVAATEDMRVRTFFLGERRVVPKNYKHVELNLARLDWLNVRGSYTSLVGEAMDDPAVEGRGFVTEFAGSGDGVLANLQLALSGQDRWNAEAFIDRHPDDVLLELQAQGLVTCSNSGCFTRSDVITSLLSPYWVGPVPLQTQPAAFVPVTQTNTTGANTSTSSARAPDGCSSCGSEWFDFSEYNGENFAQRLQARVIDPARHATQVLEDNPYVTRLFTRISPDEMTVDPTFQQADDVPDIAATRQVEQTFECDRPTTMTLPDGKRIISSGSWPDFTAEDMPAAARVETIDADGQRETVADHSQAIEEALEDFNWEERERQGFPVSRSRNASSAEESNADNQSGDQDGGSNAGGGCVLGSGISSQSSLLWLTGLLLLLRRRKAA